MWMSVRMCGEAANVVIRSWPMLQLTAVRVVVIVIVVVTVSVIVIVIVANVVVRDVLE